MSYFGTIGVVPIRVKVSYLPYFERRGKVLEGDRGFPDGCRFSQGSSSGLGCGRVGSR